jgi:hypothetical protein
MRTTLQRYESRLARSLAQVINLLDPDVIVLGGGLSLLSRLYATCRGSGAGTCFSAGSDTPPSTALRASMHGDSSGVRGAPGSGRRAEDGAPRADSSAVAQSGRENCSSSQAAVAAPVHLLKFNQRAQKSALQHTRSTS